jgi:predicted unusual protein kinase regulating ubiquinone biosynthesis (AarF/ABC1/UbiB family)/DNA-binding XRE family transcriptional regulator
LPRHQDSDLRAAEGIRLASLREALGMSQRELAAEFQVSRVAVGQWEAGKKTVPGPVLQLMALYERDLKETSFSRGSAWLEKTTDLGILGGSFVAQLLFASAPPSSIRARLRDQLFEKCVAMASRSRGITLKLAQMVWGLDPIMSPAQRKALRAFHTLGPMMRASTAARVFYEEFGLPPREAFAEWDVQPFASASLGQVHRAALKSGEQVAVKIQHPDAAARMASDLDQMRLLERLALVFMRNQTPGIIHEEVRTRFLEECDYRIEAEWQRSIRQMFAGDPQIHIPEVMGPWTSRRVFTSRYVEGQTLDVFSRRASQAERDRAGEAIARFYVESRFRHGVVNTDANPGNFLFAPNSVTFLDFGRAKRTSATILEHEKRILRAILERNEDGVKRALVDMGYVKEPATFDFRPMLAMLWTWVWPYLLDRPFTFTPAYLRRVWDVFVADTSRSSVDVPADMVFLPHVMFGNIGLLATLRARVQCRDGIVAQLYPRGKAPPPYSDAELRRFGLV